MTLDGKASTCKPLLKMCTDDRLPDRGTHSDVQLAFLPGYPRFFKFCRVPWNPSLLHLRLRFASRFRAFYTLPVLLVLLSDLVRGYQPSMPVPRESTNTMDVCCA